VSNTLSIPNSLPAEIPEDRHWWFNTRTRGLLRVLDRYVAPDGRWPVLDVGCGAGNMMHHLRRYGRVVGVDNFEKPLIICRQRGYDPQLAPAETLPYADNTFGLVALLDVVEHCENDLVVIREACRVCAPGGYLAVTVPAFSWLWTDNDTINGHKRRYTAGQLRQVLDTAGFAPQRVSYAFFMVFPLAAGLLVVRRLSGRRQTVAAPRRDEDAYQVEMEPTHPLLNAVLARLGGIEASLLGHVDLPLGSSIVAIARKPAPAQAP
jgi:SAM-dependent methyltransferase